MIQFKFLWKWIFTKSVFIFTLLQSVKMNIIEFENISNLIEGGNGQHWIYKHFKFDAGVLTPAVSGAKLGTINTAFAGPFDF